jgi:uncharacterized protein
LIVYKETKSKFLDQVFTTDIEEVVRDALIRNLGRSVGVAEVRSWRNSLESMAKVLNDADIPAESGVAIEYNIPQTGKRVDFILTGLGADHSPKIIVVELKQWEQSQRTEKDGIVSTFVGGAQREVSHPSYQAWSYAALLEDFNEAVQDGGIELRPCAYLHNYKPDEVIGHDFYAPWIERAPVFLKGESERNKLRDFIKRHVKYGDNIDILYRIEHGRIRPSKMLADSLVGMLKGNSEFVLIDEQKVVYETVMSLAKMTNAKTKRVVIVEGGPGTGKSVVAINLLADLTLANQNCRYVSKNAAPRAVYESKLSGHFRRSRISNMFSGSGGFVGTPANTFDTLIVDEAHRLNEKSGLYGNLGENQIKEIIEAAKCVVFFIDEDQRVTLKDIGVKDAIERWARNAGAKVELMELASQFRCNGSDGYLAWLDHTLGVRETANQVLESGAFDFQVFDSPTELHNRIIEKNNINNKARLVAGYCWKWPSKNEPGAVDVVIPEFNFQKRWNLTHDGSLWIVAPDSVQQIGCIHTCQGLEVDYVGVIVGDDLIVRNGQVICQPEKRASSDKSIFGWKRLLKEQPIAGKLQLDLVIKNTYRTLMTRGMKGCYIYCTDKETANYFRSRISDSSKLAMDATYEIVSSEKKAQKNGNIYPFPLVHRRELQPYINAVPLIELKFAAGIFGDSQTFDTEMTQWVGLPEYIRIQPSMFVAQVIGESMNRRIPNGSWCLFRANPQGTRNGKIVVAQHRSISDPESEGSYTVKRYSSKKEQSIGGEWRHTSLELEPDSTNSSFKSLVFGPESAGAVSIVAEFIGVLEP